MEGDQTMKHIASDWREKYLELLTEYIANNCTCDGMLHSMGRRDYADKMHEAAAMGMIEITSERGRMVEARWVKK
jgi:hypothetical protein